MACAPFASRAGGGAYSMECGSSWEVDLRSDADCSKRGLGKCHPRYTLGWRTNEVQLYRETTTPSQEYIHAYCDVWRRGRMDIALARPLERAGVRSAAEGRRRLLLPSEEEEPASARPTTGDWVEVVGGSDAGRRGEVVRDDHDSLPYKLRFEDDGSSSRFLKEADVRRYARLPADPLHVLVVVLRGQSHAASLATMPHTLSLVRGLHRSGRFSHGSFGRYASATPSGAASLRALFDGVLRHDQRREEGMHSVWKLYRRWGYVSAYLEAACETAAAEAAGARLAAEPSSDHVLIEPFCALDAQLRDALPPSPNASTRRRHNATRRRRAVCAERHSADGRARALLLEYLRTFMLHTYRSLPKLAVAVLPSPRAPRPHADARDRPLARLLRHLLEQSPNTAVLLTSDVPHPPLSAATPPPQPMLHLLLPANATPASRLALEANARLPASILDVHATLRQLALLDHSRRTHAPLRPTCAARRAVGGCSLLEPLPPSRSCAEAHIPAHRCPPAEDALVEPPALPPVEAAEAEAEAEAEAAAAAQPAGVAALLDSALASHGGRCVQSLSSEYRYELCFYSEATQRGLNAGNANYSLGRTWSWAQALSHPRLLAPLPSSSTFAKPSLFLPVLLMGTHPFRPLSDQLGGLFSGGDACPNGQERSMKVDFACGVSAQAELGDVSERVVCAYEATLRAEAFCSLAAVEESGEAAGGAAARSSPPRLTAGAAPESSRYEAVRQLRDATRRFRCALLAAKARVDASRAARRGGAACGGGAAAVACDISMPTPDAALLAEVGREADMFACDAPTFAAIDGGVLTLHCPPSRLPMYSLGLHPKLHRYIRPVPLDNGTEYVAAYCRHHDFSGSACERVGRERKQSNAAAIRRQCPPLSSGWVLDVAVRNAAKPKVAARAARRRRRRRRRAALSTANRTAAGLGVNVLVLMLDSIAAARFPAGMPMTHALLEAWRRPREGGWRSFRFDKFAVVGSNSPRNQLPMLSGLASVEWARDHGGRALDCIVPGFPQTRADADHRCSMWAFNAYKAAGYVTYFGTNMCDWGVMEEVYPFNTRHPPSDHHLMEPWCHVDYDVDKLYFRPMSRCLGGKPAHAPLMEYELQFLANYAHVPRLSWSVYLEGHEPSFRAMSNLDHDLARHLLRLRAAHGEDTAILLLSDHGIHYGRFFEGSPSGNLEHALPLFYAILPQRLLDDHPDMEAALCANQQRLVSPFDVHATLLHILSYPASPKLPKWPLDGLQVQPRSLLSEIPAKRTCEQAGIPLDICPCTSSAVFAGAEIPATEGSTWTDQTEILATDQSAVSASPW
ncbi:hypothetical protein AB1Y20_017379 [Prymnesium parvum]|uniref:Glucosidase 2 subunit beta-like domain-containing protein n=1 Tax=Prymnesium parvum TaxID=97485 RepID=A0AB34JKD3_PRYPA